MSVFAELSAEIDALGVRPVAPGLVAAVLVLAAALDGDAGATAKANAFAQLRMGLADLRELAPVQSQGDKLDELGARRAERHAG